MSKISFSTKLILGLVLLFICLSCPSFKRNPNLRLLLKVEGYDLLNPRWTKGGWVYYIKSDYEYGSGDVWRIRDDGQGNELVFAESLVIMDISPSETLLVGFPSGAYQMYLPIILYNLKTAVSETLLSPYYPDYHTGLQFGFTDTFVYYCNSGGIHRINIYTKSDTIIVGESIIAYFDIYRDSLVYYNQRICDISTGAIVYSSSNLTIGFFAQSKDSLLLVDEREDGLQLYDIKTGEKIKLDVAIEEITVWAELGNCIDFDSTGKKIIFCATGDVSESGNAGPFELWILEEF